MDSDRVKKSDEEIKAERSLDEKRSRVSAAFRERYRTPGNEWGPYVVEFFEADVIVTFDDLDYFRVPYTMTEADGQVEFGSRDEWAKVERQWLEAKGLLLPSDPGEVTMHRGGAVKALGDGRLGGHAVRYGSARDRDLEGDWFTSKTYLGARDGDGVDTLFHHGIPVESKSVKLGPDERVMLAELADRILPPVKTKRDAVGLFAEVVLDMADEYQRAIYGLGEKGLLGFSTAAPSHTVRRKNNAKVGEIERWLISEVSLTPTPAEPRNIVAALKSLVAVKDVTEPGAAPEASTRDAAQAANAMTGAELNTAVKAAVHEALGERPGSTKAKEKKMPEEIQNPGTGQANTPAPAAPVTPAPELDGVKMADVLARMQTLEAQNTELKANLERLTAPVEKAKLNAPSLKKVTERGFADDEMKAFMHYVKTGDRGAIGDGVKANVNPLESDTDAQGAVLVPDDMYPGIIAKRDEASIMRRAGAQVIQTSLDLVNVPAESTSNTYFVITGQEGAVDEDEPTFANVPITVYVFTKLMKASNVILSDNRTNLLQFLTDSAARAWAQTENKYFLTGTGSSQPQGVFVGGTAALTLDAAAAIGAAEIPELRGKLDGPYRDRAVWIMNRTTDAYIRALSGNFRWFENTPNGESDLRGNGGTLEREPVFLSNEAAAIGASAKSLLYGNMEAGYAIAEHPTVGLIRLNELYAGNLQTGLLWVVRIGGAVVNAEAIQYASHPSA